MRKYRFFTKGICLLICLISLGGCGASKISSDRIRDLEFTVVSQEEIPETLADVIDEKKDNPFQISFVLGEDLYLAIGYGQQQSGGYSICVNEFYETETSIVIDTTLIGPGTADKVTQGQSYPFVVVKTESIEDNTIQFQ